MDTVTIDIDFDHCTVEGASWGLTDTQGWEEYTSCSAEAAELLDERIAGLVAQGFQFQLSRGSTDPRDCRWVQKRKR